MCVTMGEGGDPREMASTVGSGWQSPTSGPSKDSGLRQVPLRREGFPVTQTRAHDVQPPFLAHRLRREGGLGPASRRTQDAGRAGAGQGGSPGGADPAVPRPAPSGQLQGAPRPVLSAHGWKLQGQGLPVVA